MNNIIFEDDILEHDEWADVIKQIPMYGDLCILIRRVSISRKGLKKGHGRITIELHTGDRFTSCDSSDQTLPLSTTVYSVLERMYEGVKYGLRRMDYSSLTECERKYTVRAAEREARNRLRYISEKDHQRMRAAILERRREKNEAQ